MGVRTRLLLPAALLAAALPLVRSGLLSGTVQIVNPGVFNNPAFVVNSPLYGNSFSPLTLNSPQGSTNVRIRDLPLVPGSNPYSVEFWAGSTGAPSGFFLSVDIFTDGRIRVQWAGGSFVPITLTGVTASFAALTLDPTPTSTTCGNVVTATLNAGTNTVTVTLTGALPQACDATFQLQSPICFPASATMRRLAPDATTWETVAIPELRLGDTVECMVREPAFGADGALASAPLARDSRVAHCTVYDYKKAVPGAVAAYTRVTYEPAGAGTPPGAVSMSANHHLLDPATGQARQAGSVRPGDLVLRATPEGRLAPARVLSVDTVQDAGAYVPLLSGGGLPIVDGVAAYPSSGESDAGLDAKHWGQYYLHAPVWQQLADAGANIKAPSGRSLADLGAQQPVGAFTQKWHALGAAAAREGRSSCDWAAVAKDMHAAIAQGTQFTEAEALGVLDRHLKAVPGMSMV